MALALGATLLALIAAPAMAQHDMQAMPGMTMPAAPKAKPRPTPKHPVAAKSAKPTAALPAHQHAQDIAAEPAPATPQDIPAADTPVAPPSAGPPADMHDMHDMSAMDMSSHDSGAMDHAMVGALGAYPMTREASGTAWQPDASEHGGTHVMSGDWMLMGHVLLNGVYSSQGGPRGDDKAYAAGMVMGVARRSFGDGNVLQFRAMLNPDPLMGKNGYPLLLATGETADGITPLVDRQHPHDLFMELSATASFRLSEDSSFYLYGGLPGEPAFGPPAFMHRLSIMDSPEAPISHHWLDSTHITFGVVTAGLIYGNFKIEASRFNGREPDQHRYDIETAPLDSTAARISWNPTPELSLQASWAHLHHPEQLEPDENEDRWSASAIYTHRLGDRGWWSTTAAWGHRSQEEDGLDAFVLESAVALDKWTLFGRGEYEQNNELVPALGHHGPSYTVGKVSLGAIRDFRLVSHVKLGIGGLYAFDFVPNMLEPLYGGDPRGGMAFVRIKID